MSLSIPEVEPIISNDGSTHLVMLPRAQDAMEMPELPSVTAAVPGNVLPRIVSPEKPLQCVPYARSESGIEIRGNANRWWQLAAGKYQRSRRPEEGSVFVLKGYQTARRGHVAVVKQIVNP